MNIKSTWNFALGAYQSLFEECILFNWDEQQRSNDKIDLLIFPGGEDVSLEYYSGRDDVNRFRNLCYSNRERDDYEMNILDAVYDGRLKVNKILGVCRGMQLLNVLFDGKLYQDLHSFELSHPNEHEIYHKIPSNLGFLKYVNSLHHQGLRLMGAYDRRGNRIDSRIIATDKTGYVPEIVSWSGDRILGVQFHPEFFDDDYEDKIKFREFCYDWVKGNTHIFNS